MNYETIDWSLDTRMDRLRRIQLIHPKTSVRHRIIDYFKDFIILISIGVLLGTIAGGIDVVEGFLQDFKSGLCWTDLFLSESKCCGGVRCDNWFAWSSISVIGYIIYCSISVFYAFLAAVIVDSIAKNSAGSGIPEVKTILSGFIIPEFLGFKTLVVKCLGLVLAVSSGLTLGKEGNKIINKGPLVHVACCLCYIIIQNFEKYKGNEAKIREMLSAGCAAGVAVAFGAPVGGVLFSLEEVSFYFPQKTMWKSFTLAMIGAVSLQLFNPFETGKLVLFQVSVKREWFAFELPFFILLGVCGGLIGALFIKLNILVTKFRRESQLHLYPIAEVVAVSLITAAISEPSYFLRAPMSDLVVNLFRECSEIETDFHGLCSYDSIPVLIISLLYASALKLIFTTITFGIKVPAGIFIPSLAIGACLGRAVGILVETFYLHYPSLWIFESCPKTSLGCVTPGTYAIIGAAASLAGVTRMTVSLVVIIFELTGALSYILPVMIVVLIAKWVGDLLEKESIYDALIHLNGYPHLKPEVKSSNHHAANIMTPTHLLKTISADSETIETLRTIVEENSCKGFPVLNREMNLIGFISRLELTKILSKQTTDGDIRVYFTDHDKDFEPSVDFQQAMDKTWMMVHPKMRMEIVVELFRKMGLRYILVTRNGILLGLITKKDLLRRFS